MGVVERGAGWGSGLQIELSDHAVVRVGVECRVYRSSASASASVVSLAVACCAGSLKGSIFRSSEPMVRLALTSRL